MSPRLSIREQLTAATCALVGVASPAAAVELDASLLYYTEGSRVTVNELLGNARWTLAGERVFSLGVAVDIMTGASANGAIPAPTAQTFTRPSGRGGYVVLPGETPLDDTFQDNRVALDLGIETPLGRRTAAGAGAHLSYEYDYRSLGIDGTLTRDFNKRNTTVAVGGAVAYDIIAPEGGTPEPFAAMRPRGETPARTGDTDSRIVADLLAGVTQVIDRATLARVNYTLTHSDGYHTDPFKLLSSVDAGGTAVEYLFENRPGTRTRHGVYGIVKRALGRHVAETSYRYMTDDWGIRSHTGEARYLHRIGRGSWVQPQYRIYRQSAADFFAPFVISGDELPDAASSDYRLDEFTAHTVAVKFATMIDGRGEISVRVGYYLQTAERAPPPSMPALAGIDLFPDVAATIIQVGFTRIP